ncbi:MAG: sugar ABC transporter permease [Chloroflexi bacterium]|nr:sugar ABC transporter permease [Chloroflexota bacterium]
MQWLANSIDEFFSGEEGLGSRNARFAWSLLVPTLAILILVAARPLEQTFISSLTDDEFGTTRPARWVGLENYQKLLSVRFVTVECQIDEDTGECARTTGVQETIQWQRSDFEEEERQKFREMPSEEREDYVRYEPAYTWQLFGGETGLRVLAKDPIFIESFGNTIQFTFVSVLFELILGMIIALVVNSNFSGRGIMRTAMLVPWSIPTVVAAVLWQVMMRPDNTGIFNVLVQDLGLADSPVQWLTATGPWMYSIIAVDVWKTAPFMALLILAGLQVIPKDIYEAAEVDGAGRIRQFFSITLPLLRPTIAVALIFRTLDALRAFDVFQVLLDPTRPSMAYYNYDRLVLGRLDGFSSAVGVLIFIMILIFTVIYVRFVGIEQEG